MKLLGVFLCDICFLVIASKGYSLCPANEVFTECKKPCQPTCQTPYPLPCESVNCKPGCVCRPGTVRDEHSGRCVSMEYCLTAQPWNEIQNNEVGDNESACQSQQSGFHCVLQNKRCFCKPGLLRDPYLDSQKFYPKVCSANQEWRYCNDVSGRDTCQRRRSRLNTRLCTAGCYCRDGYLWDEYHRKCVPREHCSKVCKENEEWCQSISTIATCQNILKPQCHKYFGPSFIALASGCVCKEGFIWNEIDEKCVLLEDCPNIFSTSVTQSQTTVSNTISSKPSTLNTFKSSNPTNPTTESSVATIHTDSTSVSYVDVWTTTTYPATTDLNGDTPTTVISITAPTRIKPGKPITSTEQSYTEI